VQDAEKDVAVGKGEVGRDRDQRRRAADAGDPCDEAAEPHAPAVGQHEPDADQQQERAGDHMGRQPPRRRQGKVLRRQPEETEVP